MESGEVFKIQSLRYLESWTVSRDSMPPACLPLEIFPRPVPHPNFLFLIYHALIF